MAFQLNIKNIGKLDDAKIRIGQFTVFAGPNNTGKSTVSKLLYSLFDATNVNHAEVYINKLTDSFFKYFEALEGHLEKLDEQLYPIRNKIGTLHDQVVNPPIGDLEGLDKIIPGLSETAENAQEMFSTIRPELESFLEEDNDVLGSPDFSMNNIDEIERSLTKLEGRIKGAKAKKFITQGFKSKIRENLMQNFQVARVSGLTGKDDTPSEFSIEKIGKFEFSSSKIELNLNGVWLRESQKFPRFSNLIYLESPVYWKLKNALEGLRIHPRYRHRERVQLSGVPGYFYDLASAFKHEYTGDIAFPDLYERLTGKDVLGGKIAISASGDLSFQENGRSFSLPLTAMGVANLGILALLIERKILDEDSILFIDEPEAHLHPAWQVVMAETLFDLAKGGVNVVIATHSADILKWLEVHVKKNPEDEGMIALNKFPANGDDSNEQDFNDKIAAIKQELTKPFADLYTAGL